VKGDCVGNARRKKGSEEIEKTGYEKKNVWPRMMFRFTTVVEEKKRRKQEKGMDGWIVEWGKKERNGKKWKKEEGMDFCFPIKPVGCLSLYIQTT
jgi:hypothetical protein